MVDLKQKYKDPFLTIAGDFNQWEIDTALANRWETYSYRRYTDDSVNRFRDWITWFDWDDVLSAGDSDSKAEAYQRTITGAVDRFFPLRKVKKKSTNPPWMDRKTLKMI